MASVDVPIALLGYGTVGAAVNRLLTESADDIERATGHRLRIVKALVRDVGKERDYPPESLNDNGGVLTTEFAEIADDPSIAVVAEVMGGVEPTGDYVLELLRRGKHVVTANKQLVARRGAELFATASAAGVQLRFEASVCAAIPVIKVLRESLVVTNVHRVLGIVNGTTNFVLTEMEGGKTYDEALAEAQLRGYAEADPTDDVSGADAAAKMAILATVAFNSRVELADVRYTGITTIDPLDVVAARQLEMVIRLVGAARLVDGQVDVSVQPALVDKQHPLAKVDGAFNAVMLQGDAIREITLEGPGAGGVETASAVIADITSVIGTMGTGFLQNDAAWRELPKLPPGDSSSPFYFRLQVEDRPGALARVAEELAEREISIARLLQHQNSHGAVLHVVTHEARAGALAEALAALAVLPDVHSHSVPRPVISDRGVAELGWA
ncbi:MAG TPA: homoserine dehydrogenase [Gaiellaceae bacterium]|nr:homoserine dehydrogenase [Gaiellaceae bacterium]